MTTRERPTLEAVARRAGVSRATVSRVVNGSTSVAASSSTPTPRMIAGKNRSSEKTRFAVSGRISAIDSVRWVTRLRAAWFGT